MRGFSRVLISRTFSLFYVIVITRLVTKGTMDQMIILASGQLIILQLTSFAMRYSCRQRALSVSGERSDEIRYNGVIFMVIITIPIAIILAVALALYVTDLSHFELLLLYSSSTVLLVIMSIELMIERSLLAADKAIFLNMTYSVLNSILVPLFFYLTPTLESILCAWNVGLVLTVLLDIKVFSQILRKKNFDFKTMIYLFRFGFPIYLGLLPRLISDHINKFVIYEFLETGVTSIFYWPNRILSIVREIVFILTTGSALLFTKLNVTDKKKLKDSFLGLFRAIAIISTILYSWVYLDAAVLIFLLLGENYIEATFFFRLLCIAWIISSITTTIVFLKDAQGHRRVMVKGNLLDFSCKILLLIFLIHLGLIGVVLTEVLVAFIFFVYYIKNTNFLHVNDNFIRLGAFMSIIFTTAYIGTLMEMTDLFTLAITNIIYLGVVVGGFFMIKPLTTRDIGFIKEVLPQRLQFIFVYYHPSKSRYD